MFSATPSIFHNGSNGQLRKRVANTRARKNENSMDESDNEDDFEILFMPIVKFVGSTLNPRRRHEYGV